MEKRRKPRRWAELGIGNQLRLHELDDPTACPSGNGGFLVWSTRRSNVREAAVASEWQVG